MATIVQRRRGTTAEHAAFTGADGELTVDTTKQTVVVHNGSTPGGTPLAKEGITTPRTSGTGSAVIPAGTTAQRDGSPLAGYFRYNSTLLKFEGYNGTAWGAVGGGATGGGTDEVFVENGQTVTTNYTVPTGRNAHSAGPITVQDGVTVTVSDGSRWVIS